MKRFLRGQENGKLKNIDNFIFQDNILNNIIFINKEFDCFKLHYDAFCDSDSDDDGYYVNHYISDRVNDEYLVDGKPYPGFIEFYYIFKKIYNQIKKNDNDIDDDDFVSDNESVIDFDFDFIVNDSDSESDSDCYI